MAALLIALAACSAEAEVARCPEPEALSEEALREAIDRAPPGEDCRRALLLALDVLRSERDSGADELISVRDEPSARSAIGAQHQEALRETLEEMEASAKARALEGGALRAERAPIVVLDPGHGGNEYGATAEGLRESHLALDLAQRVARQLSAMHPELDIRLTRDGDYRVSLAQRAELANASGADLFLSIHFNDAEGEIRRGGVTAFVLDRADDKRLQERVARENAMTLEEVSELSMLLASIERGSRVDASMRLAEAVQRGTLRGGRRILPRLHDRGVRRAAFQVLLGAKMPAVLLEASFLNVPEERDALKTARYKDALAEGIALGILDYLYPID